MIRLEVKTASASLSFSSSSSTRSRSQKSTRLSSINFKTSTRKKWEMSLQACDQLQIFCSTCTPAQVASPSPPSPNPLPPLSPLIWNSQCLTLRLLINQFSPQLAALKLARVLPISAAQVKTDADVFKQVKNSHDAIVRRGNHHKNQVKISTFFKSDRY